MALRFLRQLFGRRRDEPGPCNAAPTAVPGTAGSLVVLTGAQAGRRHPLGPGDTIIGSAAGADFVLPEAGVSKRHLGIRVSDGVVEAADLGSTCGTWINGGKFNKQVLRDGDVLRIGDCLVRFDAAHGTLSAGAMGAAYFDPDAMPEGAVRGPQCDSCGAKRCPVHRLPR